MGTHLYTALQKALDKKSNLSERESLVRLVFEKVQQKIDTLLIEGKGELLADFMYFADEIEATSEPFFPYDVEDIETLNADIQTGSISLQARSKGPTPIFYTENIRNIFGGATGTELLLNEENHIHPLETVALTGTTFRIIGITRDHEHIVYQVTTQDYPYETDKGYFLDARFVDTFWKPVANLPEREKHLLSKEVILSNLRNSLGLPYIWGGNIPTGVPKLLEYHPPKGFVAEHLRAKWMLHGVDCSGLLYAATEGFTPRNTSQIVTFGTGLEIAGKTIDEIISLLQPLDIIARRGHMLIILNQTEVIQSKMDYGTDTNGFQNGVKISPLREILEELLVSHIPVNSIDDDISREDKKKLVIRRWY